MTLKYFAYGSNMLHFRLWQRVPSCRVLDRVSLAGYSLNYFIRGADDSGKCNIIETANPDDCVHGVVFEMAESDLKSLDIAEGDSYYKRTLSLSGQHADHQAFVYLGNADYIDDSLQPFDWYKEIVVAGATSQKLPADYISRLVNVSAKADHDQQRSQQCFQILRSKVPE